MKRGAELPNQSFEVIKDLPPKSTSPRKKQKSYRKKVESEWPYENTLTLIEEIETRRSLWDANCPEYKLPKEALWQEVANATQMPLNECKGKWSNLRTTFNANLKKYHKLNFGQAANESVSISWKYFQQMLFLEANKIRQSPQSTSSFQLLNSSVDDTSFLQDEEQSTPSTSISNVGKRLKREFDPPLATATDTSHRHYNSNFKQMAVEALQSIKPKTKNTNTALCNYMAEELDNLTPEAAAYARSRIRRAFNNIIDEVSLMPIKRYGDGEYKEMLFIPRQAEDNFIKNECSEDNFSE